MVSWGVAALENFPDLLRLVEMLEAAVKLAGAWVREHGFVLGNLAQVLVIGISFLIAKLSAPWLAKAFEKLNAQPHRFHKPVEVALWVLTPLMLPVVWLVLQWLAVFVSAEAGWPHHVMRAVVSLLTAWVLIRLMSNLVVNRAWAKAIAVIAWTVAALNIVGLLGQTVELLDAFAITLGDFRLSLLGLIKAAIALALFLWLASLGSRLAEGRLRAAESLTPSAQVLFAKLFRILLFTAAILVGLNSVGIDLTALAVFTGAVGLGIGFGLQKVFSNLISGMILLLDRSVKPGDVIAIGTTFGWINSLGARYVSVITRDGIEHLIPNEELISQRVENWSYSHKMIRLRLAFGVSYESDVRRAMELAVEAASDMDRVLANPKPACRMTGFGDNAVNFELRLWIDDPKAGVANVRSAVLLRIWDAFRENGIEFPYAQRDLHLRSAVPLPVTLAEDDATALLRDEDGLENAAPEGAVPPSGGTRAE